jgi:DNA polymerase III alpha subunit
MDNLICDEKTGISALLYNRLIDRIIFEESVAEKFNSSAEELGLLPIKSKPDWNTDFDLPAEYAKIDIEVWLYSKAKTLKEHVRVEQELKLFKARNLYPALKLMIYIVDTMRKNNIVWGVGRGSSVASFCLYLIGVHKINSLKYQLDITEFLK